MQEQSQKEKANIMWLLSLMFLRLTSLLLADQKNNSHSLSVFGKTRLK